MNLELRHLLNELQIIDVIDILLVAVIIYGLLSALRRAHMKFVAGGLLALSSLYLVALITGLQLTTFLFHIFFTVLLLALVVLFQEELRTFLERFATWLFTLRTGRQISPAPHAEALDILISTLSDLARERIGALIVLPGQVPLQRHLHGGTLLDGKLSEALLKSLFDPHSLGHDGALILADNRIERFGCHLNLSKSLAQLKNRGTRHAAALGLAEATDALCLVVSEERGTLSVAHQGLLSLIADPQELYPLINEFYERQNPSKPRPVFRRMLISGFRLKLVSVLAAGTMWYFFVHESAIDYRSFNVPIHFTGLDEGLAVTAIKPDHVRVVVLAPRRNFYFKSSHDFYVTLPLFKQRAGLTAIDLSASDIHLPDGITFESLFPQDLEVSIEDTTQTRPSSVEK